MMEREEEDGRISQRQGKGQKVPFGGIFLFQLILFFTFISSGRSSLRHGATFSVFAQPIEISLIQAPKGPLELLQITTL